MPIRTFKVGQEIYDIDDKEVNDFLKDMPNAREVKSFIVGKDTFDIDIADVDDFLKDMPNAKPTFEQEVKKKEPTTPTFGQDVSQKLGLKPTPYTQESQPKPKAKQPEIPKPQQRLTGEEQIAQSQLGRIQAGEQSYETKKAVKQAQYNDRRYWREQDKQAAQQSGYKNVEEYYKDREPYLINNYLDDLDKEEAAAQQAYLDAKRSGNDKLMSESYQRYLQARKGQRERYNSQLQSLESEYNTIQKQIEGGYIAVNDGQKVLESIQRRIDQLNLTQKPYISPQKQMEEFINANKTEIASVAKPSQTPYEKLREYTNGLYSELIRRKEELGIDKQMGGLEKYIEDFKLRAGAGAGDELDKLYATEQKLKQAVKLLYLNRTSLEDESALGVIGKSFVNTLAPATQGKLATNQVIANNLLDIAKDADIAQNVYQEQQKYAEEEAKEYKPYSAKWFAQPIGSSMAIAAEFIPASLATEGIFGLTKIGRLINVAEEYGKIKGLNTTANYIKAINSYKGLKAADNIGQFVIKTQANGLKFGTTSEIVATLFPSQEDEVNFTTGYFGGTIGKGAEQLLGGAGATMYKIFGNKAPQATKLISELGEKVKALQGAPKTVLGELGEEFGESLGQMYSESDSWKEISAKINEQFGSLDKATQFVIQTGIMALGMGHGTQIGKSLYESSRNAYNSLPREQRKIVDEVLDDVAQEEIKLQDNVAELSAEEVGIPKQELETTKGKETDEQGAIEAPLDRGVDGIEEGFGMAVGTGEEGVAGEDIQTEKVLAQEEIVPLQNAKKLSQKIKTEPSLTVADRKELLTPNTLKNIPTEDYVELFKKGTGRFVSHVVKQGVKTQDVGWGMGFEKGAVFNNFKDLLKNKKLSSSLDVKSNPENMLSFIPQDQRERIKSMNREDAIKEIVDAINQHDEKIFDTDGVHFAANAVSEGYGAEYPITIVYPSEYIHNNYKYLGRGSEISPFNNRANENAAYNDVSVTYKGDGISIDDGIVVIPKNIMVNSETGSQYKIKDGKVVKDENGNPVKETKNLIKSEQYWTKYFEENPEKKPKHVYYGDVRDFANPYKQLTDEEKTTYGELKTTNVEGGDIYKYVETEEYKQGKASLNKKVRDAAAAVVDMLQGRKPSQEITPPSKEEVVSETVSELEPPVVEQTTADVGGVTSPDVSEAAPTVSGKVTPQEPETTAKNQVEILDIETKIAQLEKDLRKAPLKPSKGKPSQKQIRTQISNYKDQLRELQGKPPRVKPKGSVLTRRISKFQSQVDQNNLPVKEKLFLDLIGRVSETDRDVQGMDAKQRANQKKKGVIVAKGESLDQIITDFINENGLDPDMAQELRDEAITFLSQRDVYDWMKEIEERESTPDPDAMREDEYYNYGYDLAEEFDMTVEEMEMLESEVADIILQEKQLTEEQYEELTKQFAEELESVRSEQETTGKSDDKAQSEGDSITEEEVALFEQILDINDNTKLKTSKKSKIAEVLKDVRDADMIAYIAENIDDIRTQLRDKVGLTKECKW